MDKNTQESIIKYLNDSPEKVAKFILRDKKAEYGINIKKHRDIKKKKNSKKNKKMIYKKKKTKKMLLKDQGIVYDYDTNVGVAIGQKASVGVRQNQHIKDVPYFKHENILIYKDDILKINSIPENSVDLIITSPPYNVDIHYNSHADDLTYEDYLEFTQKWIKKCFCLTKNEGRFLLNIPLDKNKGGQKSVGADITKIAKDIGWKYHSTIIWNEGNISRRTAWGSWVSASAPYVIAPVELILILYKNSWKKTGGSRKNDITN